MSLQSRLLGFFQLIVEFLRQFIDEVDSPEVKIVIVFEPFFQILGVDHFREDDVHLQQITSYQDKMVGVFWTLQ